MDIALNIDQCDFTSPATLFFPENLSSEGVVTVSVKLVGTTVLLVRLRSSLQTFFRAIVISNEEDEFMFGCNGIERKSETNGVS